MFQMDIVDDVHHERSSAETMSAGKVQQWAIAVVAKTRRVTCSAPLQLHSVIGSNKINKVIPRKVMQVCGKYIFPKSFLCDFDTTTKQVLTVVIENSEKDKV
jgi:hypothetical protein